MKRVFFQKHLGAFMVTVLSDYILIENYSDINLFVGYCEYKKFIIDAFVGGYQHIYIPINQIESLHNIGYSYDTQ